MKIVIVGCGRVGSTLAENLDADGHEVIIFDIKTSAFDRLPETFKGCGDPRRRDGRRGPATGRRRGRGHLPVADRGRQPQRHGRPGGDRVVRHPAGHRQDQRPGPGRGLRRAGRGHAVPDQHHGRRRSSKYLNLPMQTGPGIDTPATPGHDHPHPSAVTIESPAARPANETPDAGGATGAASRGPATTNDAEAARAQTARPPALARLSG